MKSEVLTIMYIFVITEWIIRKVEFNIGMPYKIAEICQIGPTVT